MVSISIHRLIRKFLIGILFVYDYFSNMYKQGAMSNALPVEVSLKLKRLIKQGVSETSHMITSPCIVLLTCSHRIHVVARYQLATFKY